MSTPEWLQAARSQWTYTGAERPPFAIEPGPGQESVWDYPRPPAVVADDRRIEVVGSNGPIASTRDAVRILETSLPPSFYLPPEAIADGALVVAPARSHCEWKGEAEYLIEPGVEPGGAVVVTRTRDGGQTWDVLRHGLPAANAYDLVFRHALAVSRRSAEAEDAVHGAFAKLLGRLRDGAEIRDVEAYLHVSVRREALRALERALPASEAVELVRAKPGRSVEEADRVNHALGRLPPEQREVVVLHVLEGHTFERVGLLTGVTANTAASRYRYARKKLEEWLRHER